MAPRPFAPQSPSIERSPRSDGAEATAAPTTAPAGPFTTASGAFTAVTAFSARPGRRSSRLVRFAVPAIKAPSATIPATAFTPHDLRGSSAAAASPAAPTPRIFTAPLVTSPRFNALRWPRNPLACVVPRRSSYAPTAPDTEPASSAAALTLPSDFDGRDAGQRAEHRDRAFQQGDRLAAVVGPLERLAVLLRQLLRGAFERGGGGCRDGSAQNSHVSCPSSVRPTGATPFFASMRAVLPRLAARLLDQREDDRRLPGGEVGHVHRGNDLGGVGVTPQRLEQTAVLRASPAYRPRRHRRCPGPGPR